MKIAIIGSGLYGSVVARELTDKGYECTVFEKRNHTGGNCYTENVEGINVHKYGAHIFHTSKKHVWDYLLKHTTINHYTLRMKLKFDGRIYSMPINLNTMHQIWGVITPKQAQNVLDTVTKPFKKEVYQNAEEWALGNVGREIYDIFYKQYLEKQWSCDVKDIPVEIIARQVVRLNYDDNYFNDPYQGVPDYTRLFESLLYRIPVLMDVDFREIRDIIEKQFDKIIYTGPIDEYYEFKFGILDYKSLKFEHKYLTMDDYQGTAVMSYPETKYEFTRVIEHKHFEFNTQPMFTVVSYEYPQPWGTMKDRYYPFNDKKNKELYRKYSEIENDKVIFGGRLGLYQYLNMDQTIEKALELANTFQKI